MCGIVGYIGKNTEKVLLDNLKKLEYRGYDSAGIAVKSKSGVEIFKAKGEISKLEKIVISNPLSTHGIGHTRWATHGSPDEINAHPHASSDGVWTIVHNGIIENYNSIKDNLIKKGYSFYSETDTETVAKLLEFYYEGDTLSAVQKTCLLIQGSYALCVLNKEKDGIYFAKNKSPLYLAKNGTEIMIASDVICFSGFSNEYYPLPDGAYGYADFNGVEFFDNLGKIDIQPIKSEFIQTDTQHNYKHFMIKEIFETKLAVKNILEYYSENFDFNKLNDLDFNSVNKIKLIGCGTAYHACLMGALMFEKTLDVECSAVVASEFRYSNPKIDKNTLVVLISQSGETADTLAGFELAKEKGAFTIAIVNVEYSTLAKKADLYLPIKAGVEIAVASTKAYSAQLVVLNILSKMLLEKSGKGEFNLNEVQTLYDNFDYGNINDYKLLSDVLSHNDKLFMIGRGADYSTALEASLKIKETSYINCDTYFAGELKHGFLALIVPNTYVIAFACDESVLVKTISNAEEARARGAKTILFTCCDVQDSLVQNFHYVIKVKNIKNTLQSVMNIIPWQIIAYYTSVNKGINPDKPRNLAKSVTVE